jgi:protein involved in polysaccharide export with SLBB domain
MPSCRHRYPVQRGLRDKAQILIAACMVLVLGNLGGCALTSPGKPLAQLTSEINASRTTRPRTIHSGDTLNVRIARLQGYDQTGVLVTADGRASFLSVGNLPVEGLTIGELRDLLVEHYGKFLQHAFVSVELALPAPSKIVVMGEVQNAGSYPLPSGPISLPEALGLAGGVIRDTAELQHTLLVRWVPEEGRIRSWKINASEEEWDAEMPLYMQAHDVLFIPAKPVVHVNDWVDRYIRKMIPFPRLVAP